MEARTQEVNLDRDSILHMVLQVTPEDIESNLVLRRTLLQLPRFSQIQLDDPVIVLAEIKRVTSRIKASRAKNAISPQAKRQLAKQTSLKWKDVPEKIARVIHEDYHYLGYHRRSSTYKGLYYNGEESESTFPSSLVTVSPFDLYHLTPKLPAGVDPENVLVVSRIYSFDWAPKNCTSLLLSYLTDWLRKNNPSVKMLLTYLNPNIGFTGASLRASNWTLVLRESPVRYAYLDGDYITLRALIEQYGFNQISELGHRLNGRLTLSSQPLLPLEIYGFYIDRRLRNDRFSFTAERVEKMPPVA